MTNLEELNTLVADINDILSTYGISEKILLSDITVTEKTVSDLAKCNAKLSDAITNFLWPSYTSACVYHYTSRAAAENILNTGIFRLTNIAERASDGEIRTFCETHELNGYLEQDDKGVPRYKQLIMPNTFYASFTDANFPPVHDEDALWRRFAACGGVRLKIDITASNPDFRKIHYEQEKGKPIKLLSDLIYKIRKEYKREFILKGISRLCSFYLSDYEDENEYRVLYRTWEGFEPQPKSDGTSSYIELPLNTMSKCGYKLKVIEVQANEKPDMPDSYSFSKRKAK